MNKTIISFFILSLLLSTACNRKGCTDVDARNYNAKAKQDNFTCTYEGDVIVWFDEEKATDFADSSIAVVSFFIEDDNYGSLDVLSYTGTPPSCNSPKGVTIRKKLISKKTRMFEIEVRKPNGDVISTHEVEFFANECTPFQLPL